MVRVSHRRQEKEVPTQDGRERSSCGFGKAPTRRNPQDYQQEEQGGRGGIRSQNAAEREDRDDTQDRAAEAESLSEHLKLGV